MKLKRKIRLFPLQSTLFLTPSFYPQYNPIYLSFSLYHTPIFRHLRNPVSVTWCLLFICRVLFIIIYYFLLFVSAVKFVRFRHRSSSDRERRIAMRVKTRPSRRHVMANPNPKSDGRRTAKFSKTEDTRCDPLYSPLSVLKRILNSLKPNWSNQQACSSYSKLFRETSFLKLIVKLRL